MSNNNAPNVANLPPPINSTPNSVVSPRLEQAPAVSNLPPPISTVAPPKSIASTAPLPSTLPPPISNDTKTTTSAPNSTTTSPSATKVTKPKPPRSKSRKRLSHSQPTHAILKPAPPPVVPNNSTSSIKKPPPPLTAQPTVTNAKNLVKKPPPPSKDVTGVYQRGNSKALPDPKPPPPSTQATTATPTSTEAETNTPTIEKPTAPEQEQSTPELEDTSSTPVGKQEAPEKSNSNSNSTSTTSSKSSLAASGKIQATNSTNEALDFDRKTADIPWEDIYQCDERKNFADAEFVTIPEKFVEIEEFTKKHRTESAWKPREEEKEKLEPYVSICYSSYGSDWKLAKSHTIQYKKAKPEVPFTQIEQLKMVSDTHGRTIQLPTPKKVVSTAVPNRMQRQNTRDRTSSSNSDIPEKPIVELVGLAPDDKHFDYSRPITNNILKQDREERNKNRYGVFDIYDPDFEWAPGTEIAMCYRIRKTLRPDMVKQQQKPFYFKITPLSLEFSLGNFEPFFCSAAMYEIKADHNKKISETFYFDVNEPTLTLMIANQPPSDEDYNPSTALFTVTNRSPDIYLVLEIEKVMHGDSEVSIDPYAKYTSLTKDKEKEKCKAKVKNDVVEYCARLGDYRQAFGWRAIQLFDKKGALLMNGRTVIEKLYSPPKEPLQTILTTVGLQSVKKLGKDLSGQFIMNIQKVQEIDLEEMNLLDPSLHPILDCDGELPDHDDEEPLVKEIYEFPTNELESPHFQYVNNMYVYPQSLNFSNRNSAKNIAIKMELKDDDSSLDTPSLKMLYAKSCKYKFVDKVFSIVQCKVKTPVYNDEWKILLPSALTAKHHLLFTFYNVNTNLKKKKDPHSVVLGYGVVPLYTGGRIVIHNAGDFHNIPVAQRLEPGYMTAEEQPHYYDSGKPLFQLKFYVHSTIYPQDASITTLFHTYHTSDSELPDEQLIAILDKLQTEIKPTLAIQYLPVICDMLFNIMLNRSEKPGLAAFKGLVQMLHKVKSYVDKKGKAQNMPRAPLLELFTNYIFSQTFVHQQPVYHALCKDFLYFMMAKRFDSGGDDSIFVNSWVIFDIITKSMTLELHDKNLLQTSCRIHQMSDEFTRLLLKLLDFLTNYFKTKLKDASQINEMHILNKNLALFMKDLFAIFDRGLCIDMVRKYLSSMADDAFEELSATFRFEFLKIVFDHEFFVALNLPFKYPAKFASVETYPLANTLVNEVLITLEKANTTACEAAIGALYDNIIKNALDIRFQEQQRKERIAHMYFKLVPGLIASWIKLSKWRDNATIPEMREFYTCFLYILTNVSRDVVIHWWQTESPRHLSIFFDVLMEIIRCFEFDRDCKRNTKSVLTPELALFLKAAGTEETKELLKGQQGSKRSPAEEMDRLKLLSREIYLTILDTLEIYIEVIEPFILADPLNPATVMHQLVKTFMAFMNRDMSEDFLHCLYASLRRFTNTFSACLFRGSNNYVGDICRQILRHCAIPSLEVNVEASSLLFWLLKLNNREVGNFGRTRVHAITCLSKLVNDGILKDDRMLKYSFSRLSSYALHTFSCMDTSALSKNIKPEKVSYALGKFCRGVEGLAATLSNILRDTIRVTKLKANADAEMISDLYFQIAQGYQNMPDLRINWLKELADFQKSKNNVPEAGLCYTHMSALIADHLSSLGTEIDISLYQRVSPTIAEFADGEEGVCQSDYFATDALLETTRTAIKLLEESELYELGAELYKTIVPIYEKKQSYSELASSYEQLRSLWQKVEETNVNRLLGNYFRVGFYGTPFGQDIANTEWVYKTPKLKHLFDLKDEFVNYYNEKLKQEINIIDATKKISTLAPDKCYIQITHVEPHFSKQELKTRETFFSKRVGLNKFVFESPFTIGGKAHTENLADQYKKRTILSLKYTFPYMLTRLPVESKKDVIVSPLETQIEEITKRCITLKRAHAGREPKEFQQVLQGSVLLQINAGAIEVCRVFLGSFKEYPRTQIEELCEALREFLHWCEQLLHLNKELACSTDVGRTLQEELEIGYESLRTQMNDFINGVQYDESDINDELSSISESLTDQTRGSDDESDSSFIEQEDKKKRAKRSGSVKKEGDDGKNPKRRRRKTITKPQAPLIAPE